MKPRRFLVQRDCGFACSRGRRPRLLLAAMLMLGCAAAAATPPEDPLDSSQWVYMARRYFADATVVFDTRVRVLAPDSAQPGQATPVRVGASGLTGIARITVFADANPQPTVLDYAPVHAAPTLSFDVTIAQATPVRAAMRTADGVWHVGGVWVDAGGGACMAASPPVAAANQTARDSRITVRLWPRGHGQRLKIALPAGRDRAAAGSSQSIVVRDAAGRTLARIVPGPSLAANAVLALDLDDRGPVDISTAQRDGGSVVTRVTP